MGFVRITHKDPDVGDAVVHESAIELYAETGWSPVNADDVRDMPSDFETDLNPEAPEPPAKNASKDAWQAYAVAVGMPADAAADLSRDELITHLAPQES